MNIELSEKKILVTGGAGFIGSNLCEALLKRDSKVICLDNFSTGKKENILPFLKDTNFKLIEGDIRNIEDCNKALLNVDYVLHQAALGSVPRSIKDPIKTNEVNINGFLNMLVASRDKGVKRFIYASSSSTYGDSESLPKIEDVTGNPLSPYAITKSVNEYYASVFSKLYGLETIGLRYFNVFGEKQDPKGEYAAVIPKFLNKLIRKESPIIYGDGYNSRDFTYIQNVVEANILSILTKNQNSSNEIYNISSGGQNTLLDLVRFLKEGLLEFDIDVRDIKTKFEGLKKGDIKHSFASIDKAKKILNYIPKYSFHEGLKRTIDWYLRDLEKK